jgi:hypothetical protein
MKQMGLLTTVLVCSAGLLVACGDETTSTSGAPGTSVTSSTTTSGAGGSAATTTSGSGGSGPATTSGSGGSGGSGPATTSGAGGSGPDVTQDAEAFCADFGTTCSFGANVKDKYADQESCVDIYVNVFTPNRRDCVKKHLGYAKGGPADAKTHCPHAAGLGPCVK